MKSLILGLATRAPFRWLFETALGERAAVFMLHRFRDPDHGIEGHDPQVLRQSLEELRRRRYHLVDLEDLLSRLATPGASLRRCVAFTIDDGYVDQADIAGPAFAAFDCPVTTFVTTGFLDGQLWFWWDRIEHVFRQTDRERVDLDVDGTHMGWGISAVQERRQAQAQFTRWCKGVRDDTKHRAITALAAVAGVHLPSEPPPQYAPMSWEQLRECEKRGMSFGPHTVTHPILSQTSDAQARTELAGSWARLREEATRPTPVFCYPNGQSADFGMREIGILDELGLRGAVVGTPGYVDRMRGTVGAGRFTLQRFSWSDDAADMRQCVTGVEWVKTLVHGWVK